MTQLPISFPELVELLRACGPIRVDNCRPKHLRSIMVAQLTVTEPRLAHRVRQFSDEQMRAVTDYMLAGLGLVAVPAG